ncbi:hypothetical protein GCM10009682_37750 [Luedemannella flava]|uniref:Uncharacterized protein n=1 Tax=Luedemannella flava TaxID=349316 RepID=A0ABN2M7E1_9ACTN
MPIATPVVRFPRRGALLFRLAGSGPRPGWCRGPDVRYGLAIATALYVAASGDAMPNRALGR